MKRMLRQQIARRCRRSFSTLHRKPNLITNTSALSHFDRTTPNSALLQPSFLQPFAGSERRAYANQAQINDFCAMPETGITLQEMIAMGTQPSKETLLKNAQYLHKELPIRLAKHSKELESLPYGLSLTAPVRMVKSWYEQSFADLLSLRAPQCEEDDLEFVQMLETIVNRHSNVVPTMAQGVLQTKKDFPHLDGCPFLQDFLDRFYKARIGLRLLITQHIALHHAQEGYVGNIVLNLDPFHICEDAVSDATRTCEKEYANAPDVEILGERGSTIAFVPSHLHHMLYELLKNSMRAVVEHHGVDNYDLPPIELVVAQGEHDFAVKISDAGGGIGRSNLPRVWSYVHSTAKKPALYTTTSLLEDGTNSSPFTSNAPMAGFGYGLPYSRCFANYFGGDLHLISMEGYGTDAYVYLNKLNDHTLFIG